MSQSFISKNTLLLICKYADYYSSCNLMLTCKKFHKHIKLVPTIHSELPHVSIKNTEKLHKLVESNLRCIFRDNRTSPKNIFKNNKFITFEKHQDIEDFENKNLHTCEYSKQIMSPVQYMKGSNHVTITRIINEDTNCPGYAKHNAKTRIVTIKNYDPLLIPYDGPSMGFILLKILKCHSDLHSFLIFIMYDIIRNLDKILYLYNKRSSNIHSIIFKYKYAKFVHIMEQPITDDNQEEKEDMIIDLFYKHQN